MPVSHLLSVKHWISCVRPAARGQTMTQYALIIAAIAIVAIIAFMRLGSNIAATVNKVATTTRQTVMMVANPTKTASADIRHGKTRHE